MSKQFTKFKTSYIISRIEPCEAHWTEYYIGEDVFHRGSNWTTHREYAKKYDNPIAAASAIVIHSLTDAKVETTEIIGKETFVKEDVMNDNKVYGTGTHVFVKGDLYSTPGTRIVRKIVDYREKTDEYVAMDANGKYYSIPSYEIIEPVTSDGIISAFEKRYEKHCNDNALNFYCSADVAATAELIRNMYKVKKEKDTMLPEIKKVIFNKPATIVFWADNTKTVVKCQEGEIYDPEKGLAMAIAKKALGNNYEYYNTIKHWLKKAPKVETSRFYANGSEYVSAKAGE